MVKKIRELNEGIYILDKNMYIYDEANTRITKKISHSSLVENIKKKLLSKTPESNLLFETKHLDYILEHKNWKICLNYEWYSGDEFPVAWKHLLNDIHVGNKKILNYSDPVLGTYTCEVFESRDGHRIVDVANISAAEQIYNNLNVGWFFIVDQTNKRFKIPRNAWYEKSGNVNEVGNYIEPQLPNITGSFVALSGFTDYPKNNPFYYAGSKGKKFPRSINIGRINFSLINFNKIYNEYSNVIVKGVEMIEYMYLI